MSVTKTAVYRRFGILRDELDQERPERVRATEAEIREFWDAVSARETAHGVREDRPDSHQLTVYGVPLVRWDGRPWTIGDVRERTPEDRLAEIVEGLGSPEDHERLMHSGLLAEVNRRVLHPLGFEIRMNPLAPRGYFLGVRRTDAPEGFVLEELVLETNLEHLRTFMRDEGYQRLAARYGKLGFRGQVPRDADPNSDERDWTPRERELASAARDVVNAARELLTSMISRNVPADDPTDPEPVDVSDELEDLRLALEVLDGRE